MARLEAQLFQISQKVMDHFEAEAAVRAIVWHEERLLSRFPHLSALSVEDQHAYIVRNRAVAAGFEITQEEDVAIFLDCAVMYGEGFVHEPWASEILSAGQLLGSERAELLKFLLVEIGEAH